MKKKYQLMIVGIMLILLMPTQLQIGNAISTIVISTNDPRLESNGDQRVSFFDGTTEWVFYYDGSNMQYKYSQDNGKTWSSNFSTGSGSLASNSYFGVWGLGSTVIITWATSTKIQTMTGTISGTSISWNSPVTVKTLSGTNAGQNYYPSFVKISPSKLFLAFNVIDSNGNNFQKVFLSNGPNFGSSWSYSVTLDGGLANPSPVGVAALSNTKAVVMQTRYVDQEFQFKTYNGSAWSTVNYTTNANLVLNSLKTNAFSITNDGTCAWIGYVPSNSGGNLYSMKFCDGSAPVFTTILNSGTQQHPSISSITNMIYLFYVRGTVVYKVTYSGSWGVEERPFGYIGSFTTPLYLHAEKFGYSGGHIPVVWREQGMAPFDVRFSVADVSWENFGVDYQVTTNSSKNTEPTEAVSVANSNYIIASDNNNPNGDNFDCDILRSTNGGVSWSVAGTIVKTNSADKVGDPVATSNVGGVFYLSCFETNSAHTSIPMIRMAKSIDNGVTWTTFTVVGSPTSTQNNLDKPWLAADHNSTSPYKNFVYGCWANGTDHTINFKRYLNATVPSQVPYDSDSNRKIIDSGTSGFDPNGCNIAIAPNGDIYVAYAKKDITGGGTIYVKRNLFGGDPNQWDSIRYKVGTFNNETRSLDCNLNGQLIECIKGFVSNIRVNHFPAIAVDANEVVHVAWMSYTGGTTLSDIKYTNSGTSCATGICNFNPGSEIVINNDATATDQWEPAITVSKNSNTVHVFAYDRRDDTSMNTIFRPYDYHCHYGSGTTCMNLKQWYSQQVTYLGLYNADQTLFMGDYHAADTSYSRAAYTSWTDSRNVASDFNYDIYSERTTK